MHNCIQKCDFFLRDLCCEFNSGVVIICLFNELCYLFSSGTPEREDVVYISFPTDRLYCALFFFNNSVSTFAMKIFAKATATFVPIAVPCVWRLIFSIKMV